MSQRYEGYLGQVREDLTNINKVMGSRAMSGHSPMILKKLRPIHRKIILMHVKGMSAKDIRIVTGFTEGTIHHVLKDPLSQPYIEGAIQLADVELDALLGLAVDALRDGLLSDSEGIRLKAADRVFKIQGKYANDGDKSETAEDVIAKALAVMKDQSGAIRELVTPKAPTMKTLNLKATEVEVEER